jgi:uncharacterized RmlC-like cupin family protein
MSKPPAPRKVDAKEMARRLARFAALRPQSAYYDKDSGIPAEAYEMVTAKTLYTIMAPSRNAGPMSASPAIEGSDGLSVIIAECPPGDKPMLHAHFKTVENFFCLDGRFRIRWGDQGEHSVELERFDMISIPPGVCRDFTNIGDTTAYLLVLITGESEEDYNDIAFAPADSEIFRKRFGGAVAQRLETIGFSFLEKEAEKT